MEALKECKCKCGSDQIEVHYDSHFFCSTTQISCRNCGYRTPSYLHLRDAIDVFLNNDAIIAPNGAVIECSEAVGDVNDQERTQAAKGTPAQSRINREDQEKQPTTTHRLLAPVAMGSRSSN